MPSQDPELEFDEKPATFSVVATTLTVQDYAVYLSGPIGDPAEYIDLLALLRNAGENDRFTLYLNTGGGRLDTGLQLMQAMQDSAAHVRTVADPQAYSMGALLFLAGDELLVKPHASLMFHNYSSGMSGKGNEQLARVQSDMRSYRKVLETVCQPFLQHEEVEAVLRGSDLWLDADDILRRLKRVAQGHTGLTATKSPRPRKKVAPGPHEGDSAAAPAGAADA